MTVLSRPPQSAAPQSAAPQSAPFGEASRSAATASAETASLGELASQLSSQVSRLVRDELALAQVEAKERAKRVGIGLGMFGASGLLLFFAAGCGVTAAIIGLSNVMRPWLAAVLVGGVLILLAGLVAMPGWKGIKERRPDVPHDTVESVKADVAAVRQAMHR